MYTKNEKPMEKRGKNPKKLYFAVV